MKQVVSRFFSKLMKYNNFFVGNVCSQKHFVRQTGYAVLLRLQVRWTISKCHVYLMLWNAIPFHSHVHWLINSKVDDAKQLRGNSWAKLSQPFLHMIVRKTQCVHKIHPATQSLYIARHSKILYSCFSWRISGTTVCLHHYKTNCDSTEFHRFICV